jgi:hypothetical protein
LRLARHWRSDEAAIADIVLKAVALLVRRAHPGNALEQRFGDVRAIGAVEILRGDCLHQRRHLLAIDPDAGKRGRRNHLDFREHLRALRRGLRHDRSRPQQGETQPTQGARRDCSAIAVPPAACPDATHGLPRHADFLALERAKSLTIRARRLGTFCQFRPGSIGKRVIDRRAHESSADPAHVRIPGPAGAPDRRDAVHQAGA